MSSNMEKMDRDTDAMLKGAGIGSILGGAGAGVVSALMGLNPMEIIACVAAGAGLSTAVGAFAGKGVNAIREAFSEKKAGLADFVKGHGKLQEGMHER
jgi:predicted benzoate:H+ symporter BenE